MAVQSGWSPQFQSYSGLQQAHQFDIIEQLIHNRLNPLSYSNIDNQFSREFLIKIHEQVGLNSFWAMLCNGNQQQCCVIDRLSISGGQPESILTKFLHAGVEYVFAKLYSPEASQTQSPHEILKSSECPYSTRQGNKVCINPSHFCRAFQTSTFNPRNQNTTNLSDMILNRNESADVDLFQLNLMLEPTDSELQIDETMSNAPSEYAFRNQLNSASSNPGPVLSPTSPHSSFVKGFFSLSLT
ncbi:Oidioi.mRNA.OKI2018_I69.chr1.g3874.t1.cds [Oikopleura dioica]|uniref:Oidioi.mRNA.OKI2018_I69.chr1.g3874.t1.cds n=1 Tax=Oikopleura dioica TaxID=34765 RepID=A0ABN7T201_OIKDI|nr:Oidioi.mRNA.OKI2018_I69.chr1.g3874.t1.cds [Oikopleura dioica]